MTQKPRLRPSSPSPARRRAFTLLELLVVLGMIAILAALLLGVFSRVREGGRATTCRSNLKQLGLAIQMYADDNSSYLPPVMAVNDAKQVINWADLTLPYTKTRAVYACPTDPLQKEEYISLADTPPNGPPATWIISYGYNHNVAGVLGMPLPANISAAQIAENSPRADAQIARPSATVLMTDAGTTPTAGVPPTQWPLKDSTVLQIGDASTGDYDHPGQSVMPGPHARHNGRTNVLWADGHVSSQTIESFFNAADHPGPSGYLSGVSPCLQPQLGCPES